MSTTDLRTTARDLAIATIKDILSRHEITDPDQAKRLVRERCTEAELDRYTKARDLLDGLGVLG